MADFLIHATLNNLLLSSLLAAIAWFVQTRYQAASLANLLWVMVLIKMVTPPLFSIPLLEVGTIASSNPESIAIEQADELTLSAGERPLLGEPALAPRPEIAATDTRANQVLAFRSKTLVMIWVVGSAILFVVSFQRIVRFHFILRRNIRSAPPRLTTINRQIAAQMKLGRVPRIVLSQSNVSPFVWWTGGQPKIVIPKSAIKTLDEHDLPMVVAHEMAHIKRRDHWVRWLEWLTVLALWWNPIMWWSRRQLRVTEEIACDAMVIEKTQAKHHDYASSLLNMAELLTTSAIRPPAVASAMNSGGIMEKRLKMIIAEKNLKVPAWLRVAIAAVAICVFPLGLVYAQDFDAVQRRLGGAVEAGELSLEQANIMMEALKHSAGKRSGDKRDLWDVDNDREMEARKDRYMQAVRRIEAAVEAGEVSKEDAEKRLIEMRRVMFDPMVDRSVNDREMEGKKRRYMDFTREIEAAVKAGKLSKEDAEAKLIAVRKEMFGGEHARSDSPGDQDKDREMEARKRRYMQVAREIEAAVKAGAVSKEDAEKRLIAMRREMFEETPVDYTDRQMEAKKRRYMDFTREIEAAVKAGKLSKEDAEKKLIQVRMEMFRSGGEKKAQGDENVDRQMEAKKRRYMDFTREIEAAVKAGKLSKEDAEKKLIQVRMEMFRSGGEKKAQGDENVDRQMEAKKRRYMDFTREIEAAVKAGKMSKEDAEKKLIATRREMFRAGAEKKAQGDENVDRQMEAKKRRYMDFTREIEAAVKAGKMSKEDAEKKLIATRMEMFRSGGEKKAQGDENVDRQIEGRKRRYEEAVRRIKAAVDEGDLSAEEAERKLIALRKEIFGGGD